MWKPQIGSRVTHAILGLGEIIGFSTDGIKVKLEKQKRVVILNENELESQNPEMDKAKIPEVSKSVDHFPLFEYRQAVDALRFGLVPEKYIEQLTIGFIDLEKWVLGRLPMANNKLPQVSEIYGPFGSGKSHTMGVIRYIAKREGYAVVRVEVDGQNISLSDPEKLLSSLWSALGAKDFESPTPLLDLYVKSIERGNPAPKIAPRGIDRIHANYSTIKLVKDRGHLDKYGDFLDAIVSSSDEYTANEVAAMIWKEPNIYGPEVTVKRMIGQKVDDRPYDFVESLVGHAHVAELAGFKGLIVTIDEFEVERVAGAKFSRVIDLLNVLTKYFKGQTDHNNYPVSIFFATVGQEGNRSDAYIDNLIESAGGDYYEIQEMKPADRYVLAQKMYELYSKAYNIDIPFDTKLANEVERKISNYGEDDSGILRAFIKRYIAALDKAYGPSGGN